VTTVAAAAGGSLNSGVNSGFGILNINFLLFSSSYPLSWKTKFRGKLNRASLLGLALSGRDCPYLACI